MISDIYIGKMTAREIAAQAVQNVNGHLSICGIEPTQAPFPLNDLRIALADLIDKIREAK